MNSISYSAEEAASVFEDGRSSKTPILDNEFNPVKMLTELVRRKQLIAKTTGIAALIGIIVSFSLPVRYTASTKIVTPQQTQSSAALMMMSQLANSGVSSLASAAAGGLGLKNPNDLYIGLLTSRTVSDAIIDKFGLEKIYRARDRTAARNKLDKYTRIVSEKSGLIAISVTDKDRKRAVAMAKAYTDELRNLTQSLTVTEALQRRAFYEQQLQAAKEGLVAAEFSFQQVQQQKGVIQLDAQAKALIESQTKLRAEIAAKEVQVSALRSYSTEHNPEVELAQTQLASLQGQVARLDKGNMSSSSSSLDMKSAPIAGIEYVRAAHEVQYRQMLLDLLIRQYDAARMDESKQGAVIQVVEPPIEPDRKSSPQRGLIILWSIVLGLLGSCAYVLTNNFIKRKPNILESLSELKAAAWKR